MSTVFGFSGVVECVVSPPGSLLLPVVAFVPCEQGDRRLGPVAIAHAKGCLKVFERSRKRLIDVL